MQHRENVLLKPVETSAREIGRRSRLAVALAAATVYAVNLDWECIAASAGSPLAPGPLAFSAHQGFLGSCQLGAIVSARE
jgi:hypothetical protein